MPKFRVRTPDGVTWEINAPEGATQEQALAYAKQQYAETASKRKAAGETMKQEAVDAAKVPLIAAGRQADKLVEGVKETGLSASVAAREAMGMESGDQLRKLAAMEEVQRGNDAAYAPLKEKHPFLAGAGEAGFLMAAPVGQASAMARIGVPAVMAAANELASYGSPQERALRAGEKGLTAAVGGAGGEVVRSLIAPAKSSLTAAQQQALRRASESLGYKPRASELTGNETLRRLEDAVARQPGGAGPMRDLMDQNKLAVGRAGAKAIGENAGGLTEDVMANASERLSGAYNELRGRASMPVTDDVFGAVAQAETLLTKGDMTGAKKEAFDMIQRLKEKLYESKELDGSTYQAWTSDLGAAARRLGKDNRTAAAALREVEKTMDRIARGPDAAAWKKTDAEFANLEMLMKPGVVNSQTGELSPVKLAGQMERQFGKNMKTGKIQGPLADIASLGRALPPMREGSQTAGREAFGGLPGWLMAAPNYAAAKALTSEFGRDYLSRGLLGNAAVSGNMGALMGRGAIPLSIAEIEGLLMGYQ